MQLIKRYTAFFAILLALTHAADLYIAQANGAKHVHLQKKHSDNSDTQRPDISGKAWVLCTSSASVVVQQDSGFHLPTAFGAACLPVCPVFFSTLCHSSAYFVRTATLRAGFLRLISHTCIPKQAP
jgi:hypothetical protein